MEQSSIERGSESTLTPVARGMRVGDLADEQGVIEVMGRSFDRWPPFDVPDGPLAFLRWYLVTGENFAGRADVVVSEDRIAAAGLDIRRHAMVQGTMRTARLGAFVAVHPDFRGRGIYNVLDEFGDEAYDEDLTWSFGQVAAVRHVSEKRQARLTVANPMCVFVRMFSPFGAARIGSGAERALRTVGYAGLQARSLVQRRPLPKVAGLVIREVREFDERLNLLWGAAAPTFDFIPLRTAEFLNWRYCSGGGGRFQQLLALEDDRVVGYAILRMVATRGHLVDLLAWPGRSDVLRLLVAAVDRTAREAGATAIECWLGLRHPYAGSLKAAGYVVVTRRSEELTDKFSLHPVQNDQAPLPFLADPDASIHVLEGDSDTI